MLEWSCLWKEIFRLRVFAIGQKWPKRKGFDLKRNLSLHPIGLYHIVYMIWSNPVIRIIYYMIYNMLSKILEAFRAAAIFAVFTFGPFLISLHSFEFNIGLFNFLQSCQSLEWFLKSSIHRFQISSSARITVYIRLSYF